MYSTETMQPKSRNKTEKQEYSELDADVDDKTSKATSHPVDHVRL